MQIVVNGQEKGTFYISPDNTIRGFKDYFQTAYPGYTVTITFNDGQTLSPEVWTTDQYNNVTFKHYVDNDLIRGGTIRFESPRETVDDQPINDPLTDYPPPAVTQTTVAPPTTNYYPNANPALQKELFEEYELVYPPEDQQFDPELEIERKHAKPNRVHKTKTKVKREEEDRETTIRHAIRRGRKRREQKIYQHIKTSFENIVDATIAWGNIDRRVYGVTGEDIPFVEFMNRQKEHLRKAPDQDLIFYESIIPQIRSEKIKFVKNGVWTVATIFYIKVNYKGDREVVFYSS